MNPDLPVDNTPPIIGAGLADGQAKRPAVPPAGTRRVTRLTRLRQPYPGLRPFRSDESQIFFGRDQQTDEMVHRLKTSRFLAVVGASGCGKSSLVRAGLIAGLESGLMGDPEGSRWAIVVIRPGDRPIRRLAKRLLDGVTLPPPGVPRGAALGQLIARLRRGPLGLIEALHASPLPAGTNLLVIVDQFEEIFRFRSEQGERETREADLFIALLLASVNQQELPIFVVLTMRSDFIGDCAMFEGLPEEISASQYLTPRLSREQREQAIVMPARTCGGDIDPRLVARLLNDAGADPDQLPVLQHALMRMWRLKTEGRPAGADGRVVLTLEDYEQPRVGCLDNALSNHADEAFATLDEQQQIIAETMFRRLCDATNNTRRPTSAQEIAHLASDRVDRPVTVHEVAEVANAFRSAGTNFLTPGDDEEIEADTKIDISHESLIRHWKALRCWAVDESRSAEGYRILTQRARSWAEGEGDLLTDLDLQQAAKWRNAQRPSQLWAARYGREGASPEQNAAAFERAMRFLDESERRAAEEAAEAARERQRREDERRAQELSTRRRMRIFRWLSLGLAILCVLVVCLAVWTVKNQRIATEQKSVAVAAQVNRLLDDGDSPTGISVALEALESEPAILHFLRQQSNGPLWRALTDLVGGADDGAITALELSVLRPVERILGSSSGATVTVLAGSPSSNLLVTGAEDGAANAWSWQGWRLATIRNLQPGCAVERKADGGPRLCAQSIAFTSDGRYVAAINGQDEVRIFDAVRSISGRPAGVLSARVGPAASRPGVRRSLAMAPVADQAGWYRVATASYAADAAVWTWAGFAAAPAKPIILEDPGLRRNAVGSRTHDYGVTTISLSADGRLVATGSWQPDVKVWDAATGALLYRLNSNSGPIRSVRFSPTTPGMLITAASDGSLTGWRFDLSSLPSQPTKIEPAWTQKGHARDVTSVVFDRSGSRFASASLDGTVRVWDAESHMILDILQGPLKVAGRDALVAFSADGERVAASFSDSRTFVWNLERAAVRPRPLPNVSDVSNAAVDFQDLRLATVAGHSVTVWNIGNARAVAAAVRTLPEQDNPVTAVAFSPDGNTLLTAAGSTIQLWAANVWAADPALDQPTAVLRGHRDTVTWAAFDKTGRRILSASRDGTVRLWEPQSGREALPLLAVGSPVLSAAFEPHGNRIVTLSADRVVRLWRIDANRPTASRPIASARLPKRFDGYDPAKMQLAFAPSKEDFAAADPVIILPGTAKGEPMFWSWAVADEKLRALDGLPISSRLQVGVDRKTNDVFVAPRRDDETRMQASHSPSQKLILATSREPLRRITLRPDGGYLTAFSATGDVALIAWLPSSDAARSTRYARQSIFGSVAALDE